MEYKRKTYISATLYVKHELFLDPFKIRKKTSANYARAASGI